MIVALLTLLLASCDKADLNSEPIEINNEENLISSTGNNDTTFDKEPENVEILLHMTFNSTVSKEDALAQFEKATAEYLKKEGQMNKSASNKFQFNVITETIDGSYLGTDGTVHARVWFYTDIGLLKYTRRLDNPNINDFKKGATDYFYLQATTPDPICWVRIKSIETAIGLKGTYGWGVKKFSVKITPAMQYPISASGSSTMNSYPNVVLDNISDDLWDKYEIPATDQQNTGTLRFNCN